MIALKETDKVRTNKMIGIYCGEEILTFGDISVLPVELFLKELFSGSIF